MGNGKAAAVLEFTFNYIYTSHLRIHIISTGTIKRIIKV